MTIALGKRPPEKTEDEYHCSDCSIGMINKNEKHYRQALIEASSELDEWAERFYGYKSKGLAKKLRISAGVSEKG